MSYLVSRLDSSHFQSRNDIIFIITLRSHKCLFAYYAGHEPRCRWPVEAAYFIFQFFTYSLFVLYDRFMQVYAGQRSSYEILIWHQYRTTLSVIKPTLWSLGTKPKVNRRRAPLYLLLVLMYICIIWMCVFCRPLSN